MSNEEISLMVAKDKDEIFRPFGGIGSSQLALLSDGRYVLLTNKTKQEERMKTETETAKLVMWLLEKNRLTLRYLSRALGYSPATISNIINGKAKVSIPMAFALGSYFNQHDNSQDWTEKLLQARLTDDAAEFKGNAKRYKNLIKGDV